MAYKTQKKDSVYRKDTKDNVWFAIRMSVTPKQRKVLFHYLVKRKSKTEIGNALKISDVAADKLIATAAIRVARYGRHWKCCKFNKKTTAAEIKILFLHLHKTGVCNIDKNRKTDRTDRDRKVVETKERARIYHKTKWADDPEFRKKQNAYQKKRWIFRYSNDPRFKLNRCMSAAIRDALKSEKGGKSWIVMVDYTSSQLMKHFEGLFQSGMNWKNHGKGPGKWEIDHIIPIAAFNFSKPEDEDFKRCWALSNLQPMWSPENLSKGAKLEKHFQPMLAFG